jgi:integrase
MLPLPRRSAADDQDQSIFEIERPRHRYLKAEEEKKLEATSEPDLIDMWKFDLETGFRESNLCDARWSWFDPDEGEHGTIIVDDVKANGSSPLPHTVMLSREAREILDRRRGINDEFIFADPVLRPDERGLDGPRHQQPDHSRLPPDGGATDLFRQGPLRGAGLPGSPRFQDHL